jgi:hypothetical protein
MKYHFKKTQKVSLKKILGRSLTGYFTYVIFKFSIQIEMLAMLAKQ